MHAKVARIISLILLGLILSLPLLGCGGDGGGTTPPDGSDVIDPDVNKPVPADVIFQGRIDLTPEVEVRFVDKNLRNERLSDNPLSEDPIFEIIHQAQKSLDIATMRINRQDLVDALLQQSQITKIRIVTEKFYYDDPLYKPFYNQLEDPTKNNNNIEIHTDLEGAPRMMHARFMLVDNARTVLGSYDWSGAGAHNTIGDVVILKDARITAAFRNQFEQMFIEGLFGNAKRDATQHTWQIGGGHGRVDVYFGPTDNLRALIENQVALSTFIGFSIKEFADIDLANFILNWTFGVDPFLGTPHGMSGLINDIGLYTTPEESAIYSAFLQRLAGTEGDEGAEAMPNSSFISSNPYSTTVNNHKYLICDRNELSAGVDAPCVIIGSPNWTTSSFDFNDECMAILTGDPPVSHYMGIVNPYSPRFQDFDTDVRPEDFGEVIPNVLAYPNIVSPGSLFNQHDVPMGIVYGVLTNFKREVVLSIANGTGEPPTIAVDIIFDVSGNTYLTDTEFEDFTIDNFDPYDNTNPLHAYVIFVPAGEITISPILMDLGSGTRLVGANNPTYQLDLGPGAVRRLDMSVGSPPADDTGSGGGSGGL
ncbi:hypothetical protein J7K50_08735 [bacterium]|nr:hypothetical protein [bacterium]